MDLEAFSGCLWSQSAQILAGVLSLGVLFLILKFHFPLAGTATRTSFNRDQDSAEVTDAEPNFRPTHRLRNIKAAERSSQFILCTGRASIDAAVVEVENDGVQVIGNWAESGFTALADICSVRQPATAARQGTKGNTAFGKFGRGQVVGTQKQEAE